LKKISKIQNVLTDQIRIIHSCNLNNRENELKVLRLFTRIEYLANPLFKSIITQLGNYAWSIFKQKNAGKSQLTVNNTLLM
jgi:hypothetical protein